MYTAKAQALVTAGSGEGGTIQYAVTADETEPADEAYTFTNESLPTGIEAKTYYVWYRVFADANHLDSAAAHIAVSIKEAGAGNTAPEADKLTYNGNAQALVKPGSATGGTLQYALGDSGDTAPESGWSENVPQGADAGTYHVWYRVLGDANHNDVAPTCVNVEIAKATITPTITITGWTYGQSANAPSVTGNTGNSAVTYAYSDKADGTYAEAVPTNARTWYVKATVAETANYLGATTDAISFAIAAKSEPEPTQDEGDYSFDVEEKPGAPKVEAEKLPEAETNKLMTAEEKQLKEAGASVDVSVTITPLSEDSVPEGDKNMIALTAKDMAGNVIVGPYIDISMYLQVGNAAPRQVDELNGATLKLRIEIPKELLNGDYTDFAVIQTHDGGKTQVHSKRVGNAIELELTELCTFALIYKEVKAEPEPEPEPETLPEGLLLAKLSSTGKTSLKLTWTELKGAEGYDVYFSLCNNGKETRELKLEGTVKAGKSLKYAFKDLKKARCYKACVKAWVMRDGEKVYVSQSPVVHCLTNNQSTNTTNAKSVSLNKSKLTLTEGGKATLRMTVKVQVKGKSLLDHGNKYRFYSSDTTVATVKNDGTVKAVGAGTCEIYAMAANGEKASCKVTVYPVPEGVSFKKQSYDVKKGKNLNLTKQLKLNPTNAKTTYTWKSSDKRIAKVNSKGEVKGVKKGSVTITVKTANGKKASVTVTVR